MRTIVTFFLLLLGASPVFGTIDIDHISIGFDDGFRQGKWTPINIIVQSQNEPYPFNGNLVVEVQNFFTDDTLNRYATPLQLSKTDRKTVRLSIYYPKSNIKLFIYLVPETGKDRESAYSNSDIVGSQVFTPPIAIKNKDYFVLALARSGDKLRKIIDKKILDGNTINSENNIHAHIKYLSNTHAMPRNWIGYDAVDIFVLGDVALTEKRVTKKQQTALINWILRGGTLIVSGGNNLHFLKQNFIEQYLPVILKHEKTIEDIPDIIKHKFDLNGKPSLTENEIAYTYKNIHFEKKPFGQTILGTDEEIYIAKRDLGDGQIIILSFDYNAPPFSNAEIGQTFWGWLLKTYGKSPRLFAERYAQFRKHEEKLHAQFLSKMPTQIPIIRLIAIILVLYLLCFGGFLIYTDLYKNRPDKRFKVYWFGGIMFVLVSVGVISVARIVLPQKIEIDSMSILSIYPEHKNAYLQTFNSLRTTVHTNTTLHHSQSTFVRPLKTKKITKMPQFYQSVPYNMQEISLQTWIPNTYVNERFIPFDIQKNQIQLENVWKIIGNEATYLGTISINSYDLIQINKWTEIVNHIPPLKYLNANRKVYAKILQQEGVLLYHSKPENLNSSNTLKKRPILIGWTSKLNNLLLNNNDIKSEEIVTSHDETLVIMYLDVKEIGM